MTQPNLLVTGANGQLGRAVLAAAAARGIVAHGCSHAELPVEAADQVLATLQRLRPQAVLHCGAWTNVDGCEADPAAAERCNADGSRNVAEACRAIDAQLVYVSTDFVFDGKAKTPYSTAAATAPLSVYGRSKLHGEQAVLATSPEFYVLRTSWVFGPGGRNFPRAILDRARSGQPVRVVTDQVGRPTYTVDLAEAMLDLVASGAPGGVYHAANHGVCSWHQFAVEILAAAGMPAVPVGMMTAAELARPAARPAYSVLDTTRLDALRGPMPHYSDAVRRYLRAEFP